jgi:hypothetical protein
MVQFLARIHRYRCACGQSAIPKVALRIIEINRAVAPSHALVPLSRWRLVVTDDFERLFLA